jgi:hypothetical protein
MSIKFLKTSSKIAIKLKLKSKHGETLNLSQDLVVFFFREMGMLSCNICLFVFIVCIVWAKIKSPKKH